MENNFAIIQTGVVKTQAFIFCFQTSNSSSRDKTTQDSSTTENRNEILCIDTTTESTRYPADNTQAISIAPVPHATSDNLMNGSELGVSCAVCGHKFATEEEWAAHMDASHNASALGSYHHKINFLTEFCSEVIHKNTNE